MSSKTHDFHQVSCLPAFDKGVQTIQIVTDRWNNGDCNLCLGFVRKPLEESDEDEEEI